MNFFMATTEITKLHYCVTCKWKNHIKGMIMSSLIKQHYCAQTEPLKKEP